MDPMNSGSPYGAASPDPASGEAGGACGTCGRPLPPPDLEAVAASIDHTLSLETGRMVPRTAWAGRPPDGVMDALMFWLPSVKASRRLWERGQALWAEQMTLALTGPCDDCQLAMAGGGQPLDQPTPAATLIQTPEAAAPPAATAYLPYESPAAPLAGLPDDGRPLPGDPEGEGRTAAMPAYPGYPSPASAPPGTPTEDEPTSAVPSYPAGFGGQEQAAQTPPPPVPVSDEHESHTVILSSLPSLRTTTRLVVVEGPVHGRQFSLGRDRTTIGRSIGCHITVEADSVAYDHARVVKAGDAFQLEPAGSATETFVNDEPVVGPRTLQHGDVIRVGPARLRFESAR